MTGAVIYSINSGWVPPVDYVLEVYGDTSPAELYDGTVWMPLHDCIIMAAGDTFAAGTTGGSATATLTTDNLPAHVHSGTCGSAGGHSHTATGRANAQYEGTYKYKIGSLADYPSHLGNKTFTLSSAGAHTHTVTVGAAGGGQAWSVMNPYEAVNFWQRVG